MNFDYDDSTEPLADPFAAPLWDIVAGTRPVNRRWLTAAGLIGVVGAALLGSALYVSGEGDILPQRPERVGHAARGDDGAPETSHRGDNLIPHDFAISTAQHFRAPLTETAGGREITKVHMLTHVSVALSLTPVSGQDIPDFDASRLLAAPGHEAPPDIVDPADADVSVTRRDLAEVTLPAGAPALSNQAVEEQIAEMARLQAGAPQLPPDYSNQRLLSRTLRMVDSSTNAADEPQGFGSLDVRIIPENVTSVVPSTDERLRFGDTDLVIASGETLATALKSNGASNERSAAIVAALGRRAASDLPDGQHVRLTTGPGPGGRTIQRVTLFDEKGPQQTVAEDDRGRFVAVSAPERGRDAPGRKPADDETDEADGDNRATLYQSAYSGALKNEVPREIIEETVRAFAAGMDLKQPASAGDRLELVFTDDEGTSSHRELLFAELSTGGEAQDIYRHLSPETGERDYLDQDGVSLSKLLLRKPVPEGRISSPFGMRRHPILRYSRLHNGVDWAAPRGTPIMAAGDGTVAAAGPHSGYGNRIEIEHANGYASAYNHMAGFARSIKPGVHVHMGEIIGYVGTTGLSTGPHVHYEVTSNGHFVDPMKVKLPSSHVLAGTALAEFLEQRKQIDALRHHTATTVVAARGGQPT